MEYGPHEIQPEVMTVCCRTRKIMMMMMVMHAKYVAFVEKNPIAFSVPLTEEEESVVKKHPPKRLRMLEGQQSPPLTHEMLLEKMADAENRRQQILSQRIESAKTLMRPRYNSANKMNADDALVEDADNVGEEDS
ncbi:uncharacterized protein LOC114124962 isoform X1 [Aphis gossypii]|uniref:uncharacterized protein LOC114124962 isoform X1 n=1 Tax=Aphis gossypii TaxID=80765 RepID=UPI002159291B|nr:uncharacterized protein LOC114124962 isoform X1 [Aphis gossypii]